MVIHSINKNKTWSLLIAPPLIFFLVIVAASVYVGFTAQGDAQAIANRVPQAMPYILAIVQAILLVLFWRTASAQGLTWQNLGWQVKADQQLWREVLLGGSVGVGLAILYITVLSPLLIFLQTTIGDYVPPEELTASLGTAALPFFVANVLLAPFVEENIYRGYALPLLSQKFGLGTAVFLSCLCFGLLHWAGGFWYILLTGLVAGGLFSGLFVWRGHTIAPFAAHLALNLVEFFFIQFIN